MTNFSNKHCPYKPSWLLRLMARCFGVKTVVAATRTIKVYYLYKGKMILVKEYDPRR